tara:strand:- start:155 stop:331 length:177 start_codon:yes stop_codon:yes gene_type:complete
MLVVEEEVLVIVQVRAALDLILPILVIVGLLIQIVQYGMFMVVVEDMVCLFQNSQVQS